ncbi:MAG: HAMP domain-containing histidine kinase [Oscillospiraceae bacterium]|nr:HAMP domain-containing histidine kinase [Oscillospiraceae bacterium]
MLNADLDTLIPLLENTGRAELTWQLEQFAAMHEYGIILRDEEGNTLFSRTFGMSVSMIQPPSPNSGNFAGSSATARDESFAEDERITSGDMTFITELIAESRLFRDGTGHTLVLNLSLSIQPIDEANTVLYRVFPYALLISIVLSAAVSFIYAKTITAPVKAISKTALKMKTLEKDVKCKVKSSDEIGELAGNINELYSRLLFAINDLQNEIQNTAAADKEKIDFMLTVSHELKTPLTAVKGMIEGMAYNVGVYKDRDEYLNRCGEKIDELTALLNEILNASRLEMSPLPEDYKNTKISKLIKDTAATHDMIALSEQVTIKIDADENIIKSVPVLLFSKALSNIISNAVKYSDKGGTVKIYTDNEQLIIENNCTPLTPEELSRVFEPLYSAGEGHGLGLYLTERILKVCGLEYKFTPFEKGMKFILF